MSQRMYRTILGATFIAAAFGVLSFYSTTGAAPQAQLPFANSVEQRGDIVRELREIKDLMKEQNDLLREVLKTPANGPKL